MAPTDVQGPSLTNPCRRRRSQDKRGMTADAHCCTSRCCSDDACCSTTLHMQQHMHCAGGHDHAFSARGFAQQAAGSSVGAAGQQQQNMMTSSSSGPVTTRMHAAAICCPMESRLIHNILDRVPGVLSVDVMVVTKMVAVQHEPAAISPAALVAALNSAGLQASLNKHSTSGGSDPAAAATSGSGMCSSGCCGEGLPLRSPWKQQPLQQQRGLYWLLAALRGHPALPPVCVLLSALLLVVNLLLLLPGAGVPHLLQKGLLALVAAVIAVPPVLKKAWNGLKNKNLDMNSLVVVALFGAVGLGDWFEAGALVVLFTLAEWLEERCVQRAAGAMEDILKLQPEEALVLVQDSQGQQHDSKHSHQHQHHDQHESNGCCAPAAAGAVGEHKHSCCSHSHEAPSQEPHRLGRTQQDQHKQHCSQDHHHDGGCCSSSGPSCAAVSCGNATVPAATCRASSPSGSACVVADHQHADGDGCKHSHSHSRSCSHSHDHSHSHSHSCSHEHGHSHSHSCSHDHGHSHSDSHSSHAGHLAPAGVTGEAAARKPSCCTHDNEVSTCCTPAVNGDGANSTHSGNHCHSHQHGGHSCCPTQQGPPAHGCQQVVDPHNHAGSCCEHDHSCSQHAAAAPGPPLQEQHQAHQHDCCPSHDHKHHHRHDHHQEQQQQHFTLRSVPVAQLPVGVLVLVRPGDKVPVDGTIEVGTSVLDESMITGESKPVTKTHGDSVLAGTINCGSVALRVRATAAAVDSTVARLGALMEAAAASKSRHDMAVELFARYYTPAIVLIALLVAAVGSAVQPAEWRHWTYMSLVVLVTGCPCALVISTPVASVAGLTRAAKKGVLIKGSRALELLGKLSAASFDKSGTLTEGHFQLTKVHTFGPYSRQQALQLAAALEQHSNHPIAHSIVGAAAASGCMSSGGAAEAQQVTEIAGKGLQGQVGGQDVAVGSWGFAQELLPAARKPGVELQPAERHMQLAQDADAAVLAEAKHLLSSADAAGSTVVCLVVEHQLAALLLLSDRARSDALAAVQQLQQLGVQCLMMTGDTMGAAARVAGQLGIEPDDMCAELLPQEKLELIGTLRHRLAAGRQRKQAGSTVQRISSWCSRRLRRRGSSGSTGSYCSSCGELAADCSCSIALGPESSSMRRSGSGGFKGTSSSGMRIDALPRLAGSSSSSAKTTQGVIIAHVGDGINDAPALAGADVGVAMGLAGAALAVDAADVALFSNDLTSLPFVVRLGRRASWVVATNTVFACSIKVAVLAAAAGGVASLWLSLLADVGSSLLVTLHALTLLRFEAGQAHTSSRSTLYTSRLSGIPLAGGELGGEGGLPAGQHPAGGAVSRGSVAATAVGGLQRLQQLLSRLLGLSWLRPYDKLEDRTPAMSAGVSRLNSSNNRGLGSFLLGGGGGGGGGAVSGGHCVLTPKGSAAQELREMAILACAVPSSTVGLLAGSDDGRGPGASGTGGVFVIDDECC